MASSRWVVLVGCGALSLFGCSGKSTSGDDDSGGQGGRSGSGGGGGSAAAPPACGSLTSQQARDISTNNLAAVLHATVEATRFAEGSTFITRLLNGTSASAEPFTFADDANRSIDDWMDNLRTNIFPDANVESQTGSSVTFRPTAAVNCPLDQEDASFDPQWAAENQQYCIDDLNAHPARYVVSRVGCDQGDAVSIELVVETARVSEGLLSAFPHSLVLNLDAAEIVKALKAGGDDTSYDADTSGKATLELDTSTTGKATLTAALATELVVGGVNQNDHLRATVDASPNAAEVTADANAGTVTGSITLGALAATFPFHSLVETAFGRDVTATTSPSDSVALSVPSLTASFDFARAADTLGFSSLGLGQAASTVTSGSTTLLTLDLNPANGRKLGVDLAIDASGQVKISPSPSLELDVGFSMAPVASKVVDLEPFALDDTMTLLFDGASPSVTLLKDPYGGLALLNRTNGRELAVDVGGLKLTSRAVPTENVSVTMGQCLLFDGGRSGQNELLRGYFAGSCQ